MRHDHLMPHRDLMTMTIWRPPSRIRVIALGLNWRNGRLLASEVHDDRGQLTGVRPPGGGVEFGESWSAALMREFREELGLDVTLEGTPLVLENIFTHEGATGHEITFVSTVLFPQDAYVGQDSITFHEDNGTICTARWFDLDMLDQEDGPRLYPPGLKALLRARRE